MNKPELLAPAGSEKCVYAAVQNGADSIYLGLKDFGARSFAENFDEEALCRVADYCRLRGVKVYVTLNTLTADSEINKVLESARLCTNVGADGVIVQDLGLITLLREHYPELPVHISTQAVVMNSSAVAFAEELGAVRTVLARELNFDEIKSITSKSTIETEIFVHGAQCYSYSGQCLMSSVYGGRSGNRGKCAGPCRLPYTLEKQGKKVESGYLLSPVDMCLGLNISKVLNSGATCLKIEGRMKGEEYVAACCEAYSKALESGENFTEDELKNLESIFGRGGFTAGLFEGGRNLIKRQSGNDDAYVNQQNEVLAHYRAVARKNLRRTPVEMYFKAKCGEKAELVLKTEGGAYAAESEKPVEKAASAPLDAEKIKRQLEKLGNSPFVAVKTEVFADNNIFMPMGEINAMRRRAAERAERQIIENGKKNCPAVCLKKGIAKKAKNRFFTAIARTAEQVSVLAKFDEIKEIYLPAELCRSEMAIKIVPTFPSTVREKNLEKYLNILKSLKERKVKKVCVNEWGILKAARDEGFEICVGSDMNVFNSYSVKALEKQGVSRMTLSPEMHIKQVETVCADSELELMVYGRTVLMKTANCPLYGKGECGRNSDMYNLIDRKGEKIPVLCNCSDCTAYLLNSKPTYMADKPAEIPQNITAMCLCFTTETASETEQTVNAYLSGKVAEKDFTRGHFFRGVL